MVFRCRLNPFVIRVLFLTSSRKGLSCPGKKSQSLCNQGALSNIKEYVNPLFKKHGGLNPFVIRVLFLTLYIFCLLCSYIYRLNPFVIRVLFLTAAIFSMHKYRAK